MPLVLNTTSLQRLGYIVELGGSLDRNTLAPLDAELQRLATGRAPVVVLDLGELSSISSDGVRVIEKGIRALGKHGGILKLYKPQPPVAKVFEGTKDLSVPLHDMFATDAELDAYLGGLQDEPPGASPA